MRPAPLVYLSSSILKTVKVAKTSLLLGLVQCDDGLPALFGKLSTVMPVKTPALLLKVCRVVRLETVDGKSGFVMFHHSAYCQIATVLCMG
jgi:hypothetical protein